MKRRVKHVHARENEYVRVHRSGGSSGESSSSNGSDLVGTIIGYALGAIILVAILRELLPFIVMGVIGYFALLFFLKK